MYLKRLELQGFKSFPEKIKLDFNKGITAVVGPNGSGKSNISDAIRWVLGEQSAKSLRGAKMEDIIFAGTQNRKALGFAEVSMTIDNQNRRMNIAFSEITVTRRVYRSGESQFYINDTACRLKDIHELFMDTGIGREGYSIIGQGRIDEILSVKSEDRRLLFEEAAGIVKYKNRKHDAETKLERERQNLVRINDIISELESQLEPLFEQAEKAKSYLALAERLKIIDINLFVSEVDRAEAELNKIDGQSAGVTDHIQAETETQEKEKAQIDQLKTVLSETEAQIENHAAFTAELRSMLEKKESDIRLCHQKIDHINLDVSRLNREIVLKREAIHNENDNKIIFESKYTAATIERSAKTEALAAKQQLFDAVDEKLSQSETLIDRYSADHIEKLRLSSEAEGKLQRTEGLYEQLEQRKEELSGDRNYNQSKLNDNETKLKVLQKNLAEQEALQDRLNAELLKLNAEKDRMDALLSETAAALDQVGRRADDRISRHKLLTELENSYEGYYKSVKAVLKQKKNNPAQFSGIRGAVGELIDVGEKYETAIEIALGGALQNLITDTERDAEAAINYLKTAKEGRATFLPISAIKGKTLGSAKEKLLKEPGMLGVAKDLVSYDSAYENIFSNLLDKVLVADSLQNAVAFSKKYAYQYKLVTTEGDLINPGGAMTGGSVSKGQSNILSRGREIAALKEEIAVLTKELDRLREKQTDLTGKRAAVSEQSSKNKVVVREAEVQKASLNANISQIEAVLAELREERADYDVEERQLMAQIMAMNKEIRLLREEHAKIEAEIQALVESVEFKQSAIQKDRLEREALSKDLTNIKVAISTVEGTLTALRESQKRIEKDLNAYILDIGRFQQEIEEKESERAANEGQIAAFASEMTAIKARQSEAAKETETLSQQKQARQESIEAAEAEIILRIERISGLKNELARLELKKEQSQANNRRLYDEMWEKYNLTYQEALKFPRLEESRAELDKENRGLKNDIKALGMVNVNAVEEYQLVKERYTFLAKQRDDLIEAEEKLLEIIAELKALMEKQFYGQFQLISENFSIVFTEMFGGGTAYLKLSDETDVLESGIEIISQPPGKNLQNMMLFSGGERALTAIALLFGILRMKPSPFCILDEIEAALDDANVRRYANYLKNFADDTQFIIITHRKGTMEAADVLYGVTMQEQGVSKLVSVNFSKEQERIEN